MTDAALQGVRLLEYGQMVSAPYCAKLLADLGAEVIKIEEPPAGDPARRRGPFPDDIPHPEKSGLFLYVNTNKLGITLDPRTPTGRLIFQRLAQQADVLIEDRPPGEMERLGLDYAALSALNPALIVTSITPFGQTGPYKDYNCHHLNLYHGSGHSSFIYVTPKDDDQEAPVAGGGWVGEYDAGLSAALATIAALMARLADGEGQHIDVSKFDTMITLERVPVDRWANDPAPPPLPGMVAGLLPCQDGHVVMTPAQNHQWNALVQLMGNPAWAQDEKCRDDVSRAQNLDYIQPRLEQWLAHERKEDLYHRGQALSLPIGPVRTAAEIMQWPQTRQRGFFAEIDHPVAGRLEYPTAAYRLSETPWGAWRPAPLLGEHNEELYCHRLGFSRQDLVRLATAGVI
jgi:crotonobetainyl-CoA:carnitine CoA-transferase CaiB-like acyl-CoA transferase